MREEERGIFGEVKLVINKVEGANVGEEEITAPINHFDTTE